MSRGSRLSVGLIVTALVLGLVGSSGRSQSPIPSANNPGPKGVEIARVWLEEAGVPVTVGHAPLTELPQAVRALVLPAPATRPIEREEADAVRDFVESGGTVLYLVDREVMGGPLDTALGLRRGPTLPVTNALDGHEATLTLAEGVAKGARTLSVSTLRTVQLGEDVSGEALSEPKALWRVYWGDGTVFVAAGADLLENARFHRADNARFLAAIVGGGPVWFDEYHHQAAGPTPLGRSLWAIAAQLGLVFLLVLFGVGRRLGPARPPLAVVHRSALEYVDAFAALTHRAKIDVELVEDVRRRRLADWSRRFGLPPELSTQELAERLAPHLRCPAQTIVQALGQTELPALLTALDALEAPRPAPATARAGRA